jgi:hypothetical protein
MLDIAFVVVFWFSLGGGLLSWWYFRHCQISRAPIGVINLKDITSIMIFIILAPYLYLFLPLWLAAGLLIVTTLSLFYFMLEPLLRRKSLIWAVSLALVGADVAASLITGNRSELYFGINNLIMVIMIVGLTNLWAQSGMKARDAAILGAFLTFYDYVATWQFSLTGDMINRLAGLPLTPMVAWNSGNNGLGIGLGDLLLATVFPLVMYKAFGQLGGIVTLSLNFVALVFVMRLPLQVVFPVMVVLGPLMVLQYLYWVRREKQERTTQQYLRAESTSVVSPI